MPLYITDQDGNTQAVTPSSTGLGGASGDKNYVHTQAVASATWNVAHNLSKFPSVTVVDSAGTQVIGSVVHTSLNALVVTFSVPFSGKVYCN